MRRWGNLRIRRAAMNSAIRDFSQRPRLRGYPPKVFISYRWEDESTMVWARQLARYLRQRGFHPYLDQEHQQNIGADGIGIGKYVARIVNSNIILVVVTPAYLAGELREWLTEEGQVSRLMSHLSTEIIFLWKEGGELPDWGAAFPVVDMRGNIDDFSLLDKFVDYQGLRFSETEEEELVQLLIDVQVLAEQGEAGTALSFLAKAEKFSGTEEYRQMLCHLLLHTGRIWEGVQLAVDILNSPHLKDETIIDLALLLEEVGLKREALATICRFSPLKSSKEAMPVTVQRCLWCCGSSISPGLPLLRLDLWQAGFPSSGYDLWYLSRFHADLLNVREITENPATPSGSTGSRLVAR